MGRGEIPDSDEPQPRRHQDRLARRSGRRPGPAEGTLAEPGRVPRPATRRDVSVRRSARARVCPIRLRVRYAPRPPPKRRRRCTEFRQSSRSKWACFAPLHSSGREPKADVAIRFSGRAAALRRSVERSTSAAASPRTCSENTPGFSVLSAGSGGWRARITTGVNLRRGKGGIPSLTSTYSGPPSGYRMILD